MFQILTVREGQRVAVWDPRGRVEFVDGPRRLYLFRRSVEPLERHSAEAGQYLVVRYRDGRREHVRGPAAVWYDPVEHEQIEVQDALAINAHEAVVVYRRDGGEVTRRVERGPALYVPTQDEWLHAFSWHGADPKDPRRKIPRALRFTRLRTIPDQMYFDVEDVRTLDDALLVVKLMIFFELPDIERMLDQTHDPIADFINDVTADVIEFASSRSFEQFKLDTERLNDLATYPNLTRGAERIGYRISKVVYRGYLAGTKLEAMHNDAIEARTQLKLEAETEQQAQQLADLKLEREAQRAARQREMEREQVEHQNRMKRLDHDETLRQQRAERDHEAQTRRLMNEIELDHLKATDAQRGAALKAMQDMGVDLTRYLVAQYQNPDRLIRIDGGDTPQVHLHEE